MWSTCGELMFRYVKMEVLRNQITSDTCFQQANELQVYYYRSLRVTGTFLLVTCLVRCSVPNHEEGYVLEAVGHSEPVSGQVHSICQ
jgi:hypothetical protein